MVFRNQKFKRVLVKFMFSKKATKIDDIFTVDLTLCSKCDVDGEDFVNFCGLLRKQELYHVLNKQAIGFIKLVKNHNPLKCLS